MAFGFGKKSTKNDGGTNVPTEVADAEGPRTANPSAVDRASAASASGMQDPAEGTVALLDLPPAPGEGGYDRGVHGPLDEHEVTGHDGYVDLGALLITPREGLQLRLEVEESTGRVIAVTLDLNESSLQLQAFAAPRSEGVWDEIREQIGLSVGSQGGEVEILDGTFGKEILARVPAVAEDGRSGFRVARFLGVDGPRWFLRGVLAGEAALDRDAAAELEDLFRGVVVVRGETPLPPRDLLPLRLPKDATTDPGGHLAGDHPAAAQGGQPFRRGPEITQVG